MSTDGTLHFSDLELDAEEPEVVEVYSRLFAETAHWKTRRRGLGIVKGKLAVVYGSPMRNDITRRPDWKMPKDDQGNILCETEDDVLNSI